MPYDEHMSGVNHGRHQVAIFNRDKRKVVAHAEASTKEEALTKAKKVERLRQMFDHMRH